MKKLLGTTLALAMFLPAGANAELLKNLKLSGKIDLQGTSAQNVTDFQTGPSDNTPTPANPGSDRINDMQTRVLLSADWDLLDDVHSRVTLRKNDRVWGSGGNSQSVSTLEASFFADEAFIKIDKLFGHVDTTLGRQFYGEEGDLIAYFGPRTNLYGLGVDALDAAKFDWSGEQLTVTGLAGKVDTDDSVRAIILGCKGSENASGKAYIWNKQTRSAPGNPGFNYKLYVAGIKAKLAAGPAWLRGEFAKNFGAYRAEETSTQPGVVKYTGWAVLLNGGAKIDAEGLGMVTGWAEFGYGTGNQDSTSRWDRGFQSINTDYRPGLMYGRFAQGSFASDIGTSVDSYSNGLNNRIVKGLGVKFTPAAVNKLTVGLSAWSFMFQHNGRATGLSGGELGAYGNRNIGNEYDLDLAWQHSENVLVKLSAATFQSGGFIKESQKIAGGNRGNNPAYMLASDFSVKF